MAFKQPVWSESFAARFAAAFLPCMLLAVAFFGQDAFLLASPSWAWFAYVSVEFVLAPALFAWIVAWGSKPGAPMFWGQGNIDPKSQK